MPYTARQKRFFHTDTARRKGITPAMTREADRSPTRPAVSPSAKSRDAMRGLGHAAHMRR
jgi:hypothetical protein